MARASTLLALVAGVGVGVYAQSTGTGEVVWSSVAYIYHGERQPLAALSSPALTPLGAQQMHVQGALLRSRYLSPVDDLANLTESVRLQGLSADKIDSDQLRVLTGDDGYVTASALALVQGLYPPSSEAYRLADGSVVDFPLGGYQYPRVQSFSRRDSESTWLQGNRECARWDLAAKQAAGEDNMRQLYAGSADFYHSIWDTFLNSSGLFDDPSQVNVWEANRIYDYVRYNYAYNNASRAVVSADDLARLESLAAAQQLELNGNLAASGNTEGDRIRAVAGEMLAAKMASQLKESSSPTSSSRDGGRLTLMFGSHEPLVAFFALSGLTDDSNGPLFRQLPSPGSMIVFETFNTATNGTNATNQPAMDELLVRFLHREGADPSAKLTEYPLFRYGNSGRYMLYADFMTMMDGISMHDVGLWCHACEAIVSFCPDRVSGRKDAGGAASCMPARSDLVVAGTFGALATLCFFAVGMLLSFAYSRARQATGRRSQAAVEDGRAKPSPVVAGAGGIRGPEKREEDRDVAYSPKGVRHERAGSWELRDSGEVQGRPVAGGESSRREEAYTGDEGDGASLFNASPVEPRSGL